MMQLCDWLSTNADALNGCFTNADAMGRGATVERSKVNELRSTLHSDPPGLGDSLTRFLIDAFDRILKEKTMEGLFRKEGNAARMENSQACVYAALVLQDDDFERSFFAHSIQTSASMMLKDGYYLTLRQLLVIVKAKFFSHSAEQKIKAAGGTCVLVAKGTITCVDSARKLSFEKCRDQHVYKIISTITGVDAFRIAAFLEVGSP
ncbi:hypothetical protein PRIPAC_71421 [Pristionchus pacificus]|uniref:Large ribosomal subunit protein uL15 n=1 Tax=Pristionchus pacificus TaxID=54126 RepID=A0A2A6BFT6_PRIPA|nr:hypothetical protein PRIPAC_71421 [Pristionchus pacificus]|eukprot:PDM64718.1 ribosomal protein [Pristionchus pacificus]